MEGIRRLRTQYRVSETLVQGFIRYLEESEFPVRQEGSNHYWIFDSFSPDFCVGHLSQGPKVRILEVYGDARANRLRKLIEDSLPAGGL